MRHRSFLSPRTEQKSHRAKKYLGQNFLVDPHVIERIIENCQLSKDEIVLEIGPGTGALTRHLLKRTKKVIAIETDHSLVDLLNKEFAGSNIEIIHGDFLKLDLTKILQTLAPIKVVGNLPYYISTPIMTKVIKNREFFKEFYLTVQKEFALRLVASSGTKDYGSLSCFVQYYSLVEPLFHIKSTCFKPKPKVDSSFLRLQLRQTPEFPSNDEDFLFAVIRYGFQQRRKTLINALSSIIEKESLSGILDSMGISLQVRAEALSLETFVMLSQRIQDLEK